MIGAPKKFRLIWTALIVLLTVAPYVLNYFLAPPGHSYTWFIPPYPADSYAYRAWSQQAFDGARLFSFKFTAHAHRPFLFLPFFAVAGRLARVSGWDIGFVHLILKTFGVVAFFWAFNGLLHRWKFTPFQSVAANIFAGISSGAGGLLPLVWDGPVPDRWIPIDAWLVDSNTFWSLLWNPVFPCSLTLMLLALRFADEAADDGGPRKAWLSGLCLCALALIHPYPLAVMAPLITALYAARHRKNGWMLWLRTMAAAAPGTLYVVGLSAFHPLVRLHNSLGTGAAPTLPAMLLGFGWPMVLAAAGIWTEGRDFLRRYWLTCAWAALALTASLLPIWFHVKYLFGAHLPICILAAASAERLFGRFPPKAAVVALLLVACPLTQVHHLLATISEPRSNPDVSYWVSGPMMDALRYLRSHADRRDVVFARPPTSAQICAYAGNSVFWGHWAQAVDRDEQEDMLRTVTSDDSWLPAAARRRKFWDFGIDWVLVDGEWRDLFDRGPAAALVAQDEKVFENSDVTIYRRRDGGSSRRNRSYQAAN